MPPLELPIFPLGVVLFPGAPQLLHIFEPRYRQMLADCLEGTRRFGISYVKGDDDVADPTPVPGAVGCTAIVRESRLLPDGRSTILAEGEQRYVLLEYLQTDLPYRVAQVEPFDDEDDQDGPQSVEAATELRSLFARFTAGMGALSDRGVEPAALARDPRQLSFQVAAALEVEPDVKVQLLGMRSTLRRLSHLNRLLRPLNTELDRRVEVHVRARTNGRGGPTRDIVKGQ